MRWYAKNDLFFLMNNVLSEGNIIHSDTGIPFYWHQSFIDWCRQIEARIAKGGGLEASSRGSGKSTLITKGANIQRILKYPNSTGCLFSFERKFAKKHFRTIKNELEQNDMLKYLFDDILHENPRDAAKTGLTTWSVDEGILVKRTKSYKNMTLEYQSFEGTPTGGRYDWMDFDDIETDRAVGSEANLEKLHQLYDASIMLLTGREIVPPVINVTNTFYSDLGLAKRVERRYMEEDPTRCRVFPGENLNVPGPGPLGGTPSYPHTEASLSRFYKEIRDKSVYAIQICGDFRAGEDRIFQNEWLIRYDDDPQRIGRGRNIYICVDPSRGQKLSSDPTAVWVWGLGMDKKFVWLDGFVKRLDPALPEFMDEIIRLIARWQNVGKRVVEIRVENFGQATYDHLIKKGLEDYSYYGIPVVSCHDNRTTGKFLTGKRDREFERWASPASSGDVMIPRPRSEGGRGIVQKDSKNNNICLVDEFLEKEWNKFPKPITDHLLDAGSLVWEPEDRTGRVLLFPRAGLLKRRRRHTGTTAMSM
jgi:hypothetical protein